MGDICKKLLLLSLVLLAMLIFSEGLLRFLIYLGYVQDPYLPTEDLGLADSDVWFQPDRVLGYVHRPNFTGSYLGSGAPYTTNSDGFRDNERVNKDAGTYRIIFIGDSVTLGWQFELDETIPEILEKKLNENSKGTKYDVVNMGVMGYSTYQELLLLEEKGILYEPDMILLGFVLNDMWPTDDLFSNMDHLFDHTKPPDEITYGIHTVLSGSVFFRTAKNFFRWLKKETSENYYANLNKLGEYNARFGIEKTGWWGNKEVAVFESHVEKQLMEFKKNAEDSGAGFAIVMFPYREQLHDERRNCLPQMMMRNFTSENDISFIDLFDRYKLSDFENIYVDGEVEGVHPNGKGNEIAAAEIYEWIGGNILLS